VFASPRSWKTQAAISRARSTRSGPVVINLRMAMLRPDGPFASDNSLAEVQARQRVWRGLQTRIHACGARPATALDRLKPVLRALTRVIFRERNEIRIGRGCA